MLIELCKHWWAGHRTIAHWGYVSPSHNWCQKWDPLMAKRTREQSKNRKKWKDDHAEEIQAAWDQPRLTRRQRSATETLLVLGRTTRGRPLITVASRDTDSTPVHVDRQPQTTEPRHSSTPATTDARRDQPTQPPSFHSATSNSPSLIVGSPQQQQCQKLSAQLIHPPHRRNLHHHRTPRSVAAIDPTDTQRACTAQGVRKSSLKSAPSNKSHRSGASRLRLLV